jgi:hypothetical protein
MFISGHKPDVPRGEVILSLAGSGGPKRKAPRMDQRGALAGDIGAEGASGRRRPTAITRTKCVWFRLSAPNPLRPRVSPLAHLDF